MFHRGQKIIITESSAKNKLHPTVGDVGYIENMFLFPEERFILMSIIMCSYNSNKGERSEHKKFIIDLNMESATRREIAKGVNKLFFLSKNSVNLLPAFLKSCKIRRGNNSRIYQLTFPQIVGTYGIYTGYMNPCINKRVEVDTKVIIPYGHIKVYNDKSSIIERPLLEIKSWVRSLLPNTINLMFLLAKTNNSEFNSKLINNGYSLIQQIEGLINKHVDRLDGIRYSDLKFNTMSSYNIKVLVSTITKLNALSYGAVMRLFMNATNNMTSVIYNEYEKDKSNIAFFLNENPVWKLMNLKLATANLIKTSDAYFISECVYKAIFADRNTSILLNYIKHHLPSRWDIDKISQQANDIKKDISRGSAALNRLFDLQDALINKITLINTTDLNINSVDGAKSNEFFINYIKML